MLTKTTTNFCVTPTTKSSRHAYTCLAYNIMFQLFIQHVYFISSTNLITKHFPHFYIITVLLFIYCIPYTWPRCRLHLLCFIWWSIICYRRLVYKCISCNRTLIHCRSLCLLRNVVVDAQHRALHKITTEHSRLSWPVKNGRNEA